MLQLGIKRQTLHTEIKPQAQTKGASRPFDNILCGTRQFLYLFFIINCLGHTNGEKNWMMPTKYAEYSSFALGVVVTVGRNHKLLRSLQSLPVARKDEWAGLYPIVLPDKWCVFSTSAPPPQYSYNQ